MCSERSLVGFPFGEMPQNFIVRQEKGILFANSEQIAINCTESSTNLPSSVRELIADSLAENSKRGYASDLSRFEAWGGAIPASPETVATYLASHAPTHKVATLTRWLASISKAHQARGAENPVRAELVKATLRGIRRTYGVAQREAKPILKEDLFEMLAVMGNRPKDVRDRALLLLGFAGAFRRSELVGLNIEDVEQVRHGLVVLLKKSKTDQEGRGRKVGIPFGRGKWCPVTAVTEWIALAKIEDGPIFRVVDRHSRVGSDRLSGEAVCLVVRERVSKIALDPAEYSGHSLRAGLATSAAQAGVPSWKIRAQTGHASDAMLNRYIRDSDLFSGNAAGAVV